MEAGEEPPEKRARVEEEAAEKEADAPPDSRPPLAEEVRVGRHDCTLNVVATNGGRLLAALSDVGMQHLLACARADTAVRSGRYMFETRIVGMLNPVVPGQRSAPSAPRQHVRVGFSLGCSSLFLGDTSDSVCFDSEGFFVADQKRVPTGQRFTRDQVVGLLLNIQECSPAAHTVSLFVEGRRASTPQPLPAGLRGKPLFPHMCFRNVTLQVHFGPEPLAPLPFRCRTLQEAAAADCSLSKQPGPKDGKFEVLFPIAIPDEGTFEWLDAFLEDHPEFTELSDRAIVEWAVKSGMYASPAAQWNSSNDRPRPNFGVQALDDFSVKKLLHAVAQLTPRNYVVMEVKSNLVKSERREAVKPFNAANFRTVAQVQMGEPDMAFKSRSLAGLLREKQEKANLEWKGRQAIKERWRNQARALAAKNAGGDADSKEEVKDEEEDKGEVKEEQDEKDDKVDLEEPPIVELTDDEQNAWFRTPKVNDIFPTVLEASFSNFSLPEVGEGFSEIRWGWQDEADCKSYFKKWQLTRKLLSRVEGVQATEPFVVALRKWSSRVKDMQAQQTAFKQQEQAMRELSNETDVKEDNGGEDKPGGTVEGAAAQFAEATREPADVMAVENVYNVGGGRPLFASFQHEDWAVLSLRFELLLLVTSFARDTRDPQHPGMHESLLPFYYAKYYGKPLNASLFGLGAMPDLIELVRDTVAVDKDNSSVLIAKLPEDELTSPCQIVKFTETGRRERQMLQSAGTTAALSGLLPAMQEQQLRQLLHHPLLHGPSEDDSYSNSGAAGGPRVIPASVQQRNWQGGGSWGGYCKGSGSWGQKGCWGDQKGAWGSQPKGCWQKGGWGGHKGGWGEDVQQQEDGQQDGGSWGQSGGWSSAGGGLTWQSPPRPPSAEASMPKVLPPTASQWVNQESWS